MKTNDTIGNLLRIVFWITGILVALAVGFGMVDGILTIWFIPQVVTSVAGWIVIVLTVLGAILSLFDR